MYIYSQTWLESHCLQHQPLYNNTHGRNGFNGLCTKCPGHNNDLVITAHFSGTKGVAVNKFDCICPRVTSLVASPSTSPHGCKESYRASSGLGSYLCRHLERRAS